MPTIQTQPGTAPTGPPVRPLGILSVASPAPEGWEQGGLSVSTIDNRPLIIGDCEVEAGDPNRPATAEFFAFTINQSSACATISGDQRQEEARQALEATTDFALSYALRHGASAVNDSTTLEDAVEVTSGGDVLAAIAALEVQAALAGSGRPYVLHASPDAAVYLKNAGLIDGNGRSPSGAAWIISPAYYSEDGLVVFATGQVWAAAGDIAINEGVDRRTNNREAWAVRSGIVGFDPSVNLYVTFTPTAPGGGDVDQEARDMIEALSLTVDDKADQSALDALTTTVAGKADAAHTHAAGDIDSGTFTVARIPQLSTSKITGLQDALDSKGQVDSVTAGSGISVDATDPSNPVISTEI